MDDAKSTLCGERDRISEKFGVKWRFTHHGPIRISYYNRGYKKFDNGIRWFRIMLFGKDIGGLWFHKRDRLPRLLGPNNRMWGTHA